MWQLKKTFKCQHCIDTSCSNCTETGALIKTWGPYADINIAFRERERLSQRYVGECKCRVEVVEI